MLKLAALRCKAGNARSADDIHIRASHKNGRYRLILSKLIRHSADFCGHQTGRYDDSRYMPSIRAAARRYFAARFSMASTEARMRENLQRFEEIYAFRPHVCVSAFLIRSDWPMPHSDASRRFKWPLCNRPKKRITE